MSQKWMIMQKIYKGQTLRWNFALVDEDDQPLSTLARATADLRIAFGADTIRSFPAVVDPVSAEVTITVDRSVTATWRRGEYQAQVWVDYGEGEEIEAEVIYADEVVIEEGF